MSIRTRLNLAVASMIVIFLVAGLTTLQAVSVHAAHTRRYTQVRTLSHLTAWVRTEIYQHLASLRLGFGDVEIPDGAKWPTYVLDDIDQRIELADNQREQDLWEATRNAVVELSGLTGATLTQTHVERVRQVADVSLRALRNMYVLREHELIAASARASLKAQKTVAVACVLTVLLFLVYLLMIRRWLLKPVDTLKRSADIIGDGVLQHRVPLQGDDELSQLARRLDAMAGSLQRHQQALIEARELSAVGELCSNVAHGLRNPLASIRATAQLSLRKCDNPEEVKAAVREIIEQTDRMNSRITELFEYSRPMELHRDCTTFRETAEAATSEVAALLRERDIKLLIDDDTEGAIWCVDRQQMSGALAELISNAAYHSDVGREIIVRSDRVPSSNGRGPQYRLQVRDVGCGMPRATLEKAFTPFFSGREGGTGMGLALVRRVVERHSGDIQITSDEGKGTSVTMTFHCACPNPLAERADEHCRERLHELQLRQTAQ